MQHITLLVGISCLFGGVFLVYVAVYAANRYRPWWLGYPLMKDDVYEMTHA